MFILSLLCVLCTTLFNTSNIKSDVISNDVIYQKETISPKMMFNNDTYLSKVNNLEAYRYYSDTYTYQWQNKSNTGCYVGWFDLDNVSSGKGYWGGNADIRSAFSGNFGNVVTSLDSNRNYIYINDSYEANDEYYMLFRFFLPYNSPVQNIEFNFSNWYGIDYSNLFFYGYGGFSGFTTTNWGAYTSIGLTTDTYFLIHEVESLNNNGANNQNMTSYGAVNKFCYYWFCLRCSSSSGSAGFTLNANYLGSFDRDYQNGYDIGYANGYSNGQTNGYQSGYSAGYDDGVNVDDTALTIFTGILEIGMLPVNVFLAIFNFEVFGINISGIVSALLTVAVVIIILRFLLGGKSKDD